MKSCWVLDTNGDPLETVRQFLADVWASARLDGMLVPLYQERGASVAPCLVADLAELAEADPFAPLMPVNAAILAPQFEWAHPGGRFGAVLRSCEARAFRHMVEQRRLASEHWLVIGVDCLASFSAADFEWRLRKTHRVEALTREALRFARQGGIAPHRFRDACQMCPSPAAQDADVSIELLGLPVRQFVMISARDADLARGLHLEEITDGEAPESWVARREATLELIAARRKRSLARKIQALSVEAPAELEALLRHIANCAPCQACLEACPLYTGDFLPAEYGEFQALEAARAWLERCVSCGMCEEACPKHLPLTAILTHIAHPATIPY